MDLRGFRYRSVGPRVGADRLDRHRTASPSRTARNDRRKSDVLPEPRAGVPDRRGRGRARRALHRRSATPGTSRTTTARPAAERHSTTWSAPASTASTAWRICAHPTASGIRWFSPLGPLRFEWGFPFNTAALRGKQRLRVHDRQLLLIPATTDAERDTDVGPRTRPEPRCRARRLAIAVFRGRADADAEHDPHRNRDALGSGHRLAAPHGHVALRTRLGVARRSGARPAAGRRGAQAG